MSNRVWSVVSALSVLNCAVAVLLAPQAARSGEPAVIPRHVNVGGHPLALRGHGVSTRWAIEVCAVALYAPRRLESVEDILDGAHAGRIMIVMLRGVSREHFRKGLASVNGSARPATGPSAASPPLRQFSDQLAASLGDLAKGDVVTIDWIPGVGVTVSHNARVVVRPVADPELFRQLAALWVGPDASDAGLRSSLLGGGRSAQVAVGSVSWPR